MTSDFGKKCWRGNRGQTDHINERGLECKHVHVVH